MDLIGLLPILAFVALASGIIVVFRRTGSIVARTREVEAFQQGMRDLGGRAESALASASERIDLVRHHELDASALGETLTGATAALDGFRTEATALRGPREARDIRDELVAALERANRALDMVEHGATIMTTGRGSLRELEAQTSIKRGYLNLVHAREAIRSQVQAAERLTEAGVSMFRRRAA